LIEWYNSGLDYGDSKKQDIKRVRLGPKLYSSHMTFALERTQTEVFIDFKEKYPNVKISQRLYEIPKPYFLIQARPSYLIQSTSGEPSVAVSCSES
jgi:hypothetical protein